MIPDDWKNPLGILSAAMAVVAAIVYVVLPRRDSTAPAFVVPVRNVSATRYWAQREQGARQCSWALMAMTIVCFLFVAASVMRGERSFSRQEWAFAVAGGAVFFIFSPGRPMWRPR